MRRALGLVLVAVLALPAVPDAAADAVVADPTAYVDPLIGTGGDGFTVPGATTPFGMTMVSPDTVNPLAYSGYKYEDAAVRGFSFVHVNGAGVPMGGELPFLPVTAPVVDPSQPLAFAVPFTHATERATAGGYGLTLGNGVHVELAATPHGGVQQYASPVPFTLVADLGRDNEGVNASTVQVVGRDRLEGSVLVHWRGGDFTVFLSAWFSQPFTARTFVGSGVSDALTAKGSGAGALLSFPAGTVDVRAGLSYVDLAGARANLAQESASVVTAQSRARNAWRAALSRIRVGGGTDADKRVFYTSLYRSLLHPDVDSDIDGRYRGADAAVHSSTRPHYEDFSLWDTIRGENALLAVLFPDRYRDMVASLAAFGREAGQLPRWSLHGAHPDYMNGDPAIPTLAEAVCRGTADDPESLYQQAVQLTTQRPADVRTKGWAGGSAADTLEYADADFALSLMARRLGHIDDAAVLLKRSLAWQHLLHEGFLQPRQADGSWPANYDPTSGDGYREGTGWQYLWLAPHDQAGLRKAYGPDGFEGRLDHLFGVPLSTVATTPVVPLVQSTETAFGTSYRGDGYVPGNEHDLEAPYSYDWSPRPSTGQAVLASVRSLFLDNPEGMPGNDDLGSLSAWWVWSALGIYPSIPGAPMYVTGTPLFERAELTLGGGKAFVVTSTGTGPYVAGLALNGKPSTRTWFTTLHPGGSAAFTLSTSPTTWGAQGQPPSASQSGLSPFGC
jgi:predicted alpha-1,2-mannosidase